MIYFDACDSKQVKQLPGSKTAIMILEGISMYLKNDEPMWHWLHGGITLTYENILPLVVTIILGIVAIICLVLSYLQFQEKGFLFNNAYIYASKQERETMDKKPHYKQSGIVFLMIGIIFLINVVEMILETGWLFYFVIFLTVLTIAYAIISSVVIERNRK